jgi:hypothetical protein
MPHTTAAQTGEAEMAKNSNGKGPSATKSGPGRRHKGGEPGNKLAKSRPVRAYVALMAAWAQKRVVKWEGERDEHGAFTRVGTARNIWLAGISAQRGY